jgi:hypothetical protein
VKNLANDRETLYFIYKKKIKGEMKKPEQATIFAI